ncbi:hypothetical protein PtA15_5A557 [Puccinia triticina]|uniref:Uncharacterized protein n=1 Tax=Puccinia triticina TaxID=208348 RepID=A0ABY7CJY9_9BASI|nr:uncharacterized protein PtA15_5A557 [Puccinia triticina]WAQ84984.1 hypothetical protein PtA15_5A557 [Puccinia triticina]
MDEEVDHAPGPVHSPETVPKDVLLRPPRVAPVHLDYCLFVQVRVRPDPPEPGEWRKISPDTNVNESWMVNIQSMTWKHFQSEYIKQIVPGKPFLVDYFQSVNETNKLSWYGKIENDSKYGIQTRIEGQLAFEDFAMQAYDAYPSRVEIRAIMEEPVHALHAEHILIKQLGPLDPSEGSVDTRKYSLPKIPCKRSRIALGGGRDGMTSACQEEPFDGIQVLDPITGLYSAITPKLLRLNPKSPASAPAHYVDMPFYLKVAHLPDTDEVTCARLIVNGIIHWTFFQTSSKGELLKMGFPLGTSRLLSDGVSQLHQYLREHPKGIINDGEVSNGSASTPSTSKLASPKDLDHLETYLNVALIEKNDLLTRALMKIHGIVHWSFFRKSSEDELTELGFSLGTSRLLIAGVVEMQLMMANHSTPKEHSKK